LQKIIPEHKGFLGKKYWLHSHENIPVNVVRFYVKGRENKKNSEYIDNDLIVA
jgi:hypothetical protein